MPTRAIGTFSIVPCIVDAAAGRIPVMAAGGISGERTARAAFAPGAEGLYVGTAMMMPEESPPARIIKELALKANADDLIMYRTVPAFHRSLPGELPNRLLGMSKEGRVRRKSIRPRMPTQACAMACSLVICPRVTLPLAWASP